MVLESYEKIKTVRLAIRTTHTPNLDAIAHWLSDSADRSLLQRAFPSSCSRGSTADQILQQYIVQYISVARGGHGKAFALPSLNFALPSKPSSYLNCI